jgi:hypothetical protein
MQKKSKVALPYVMFSLVQHNISVMGDCLPGRVFGECGLDFDLWYPYPRRLVGSAPFLLKHRRERAQHRRTLETVRQRFDVRCGPLPTNGSRQT